MLTDYIKKIKSALPSGDKLNILLLIILASVAGFGAMRLWLIWPEKSPIVIEGNSGFAGIGEAAGAKVVENAGDQKLQGKYVASKNGKSYHLPWCPGALNIKEENKIWFNSKEEAEKAGYTAARNCPGFEKHLNEK